MHALDAMALRLAHLHVFLFLAWAALARGTRLLAQQQIAPVLPAPQESRWWESAPLENLASQEPLAVYKRWQGVLK